MTSLIVKNFTGQSIKLTLIATADRAYSRIGLDIILVGPTYVIPLDSESVIGWYPYNGYSAQTADGQYTLTGAMSDSGVLGAISDCTLALCTNEHHVNGAMPMIKGGLYYGKHIGQWYG